MAILLTGGAGYIGSHVCAELLKSGYEVIVADNLCNSSHEIMDRIGQITGRAPFFRKLDIRDAAALDGLFTDCPIDGAIHLAGLKSVRESVSSPLEYYHNNISSTITLCAVMRAHGIKKLIFSSSATVYSESSEMPLTETSAMGGCANPYGWSKFMCERILMDLAASDPEWSIVLLRYFNPIGAHESGLLGEDPKGTPNNLMPHILRTAAGEQKELKIFGNDYGTPDGTGIRDYIHVCDLAEGHAAALDYAGTHKGCEAFNLGTGIGYSVLDVINTFERVNGIPVPHSSAGRRPGDLAAYYADPSKSHKLLHWRAARDLSDMCRDAWRYKQSSLSGR